MSAISRVFNSSVARSMVVQQHRHMASTSSGVSDPIQKLFIEKIRDFKTNNKGLDAAHAKALQEDIIRLVRLHKIGDESKLTQLEHKFPNECQVSLHDLDETKEIRAQIHSGEFQKNLVAQAKPESALMASTPDQTQHDLHLPPMNKPDVAVLNANYGVPPPTKFGESLPDYHYAGDRMTSDRLQREMLVKFDDKMPTIHDDKAPERDIVNFPRLPQPLDTPPTRYHVIPESWFQFFYPKTGVTGPYAFFASFSTFLMSKEWVPVEHEFATLLSTTIIFSYAVSKFGPKVGDWLRNETKKQSDGWDKWQQGNIALLDEMVQHYKDQISKNDLLGEIYAARRDDVDVQLECERRNRLKTAYDDVKRRLNFLVAKADAQRTMNHTYMANWVISNVMSSIDQKRENEVLDSCVNNLRHLAQKNAHAI